MSELTPDKASLLRRGLRRLRFLLERLILRGVLYRLLFAATIILGVALGSGLLAAAFDAGFSDIEEAIWWAFLRLTDPGYLGDDEGTARRTISTLVTVLGYVLFLGLLIAILTQWMNELISKLESGLTPVALSDHVIVLGWTHSTPTIVLELLSAEGRVQQFLERRGARALHVVVLADHVDSAVTQELRERLGGLWDDRRVLLRAGTPLRVDHLDRVAFRNAAVMILPGADFGERNPEVVDAQTIKTLMSISKIARASGSAPPLAVAELYDGRSAAIARRAYRGDSEIIAADEIMSRLIAQSIQQPGLSSIFSELLTVNQANGLYLRQFEEADETTFAALRTRFTRAVLLGSIRSEDAQLVLDPDPQAPVRRGDLLVCLARDFDACRPDRDAQVSGPTTEIPASPPTLANTRRVLVLGWSRKVPALIRKLARSGEGTYEIDVVSGVPIAAREKALERYGSETTGHRVQQIEADFTVPGVLADLAPGQYDNVVRLASERLEGEEQADATTVLSYLMLDELLPDDGERPAIFVELLEEQNRFLFNQELEDVIVSPLLLGFLVSQVALQRELADVFAELTRPWGPQIVLQPAAEYLPVAENVCFEDLEVAAHARGEIALGLRRPEGRDAGLWLNPDRDEHWVLAERDEVVVLASYAGRGGPT